jgi:hypothetical protein
VDEELEQRLRDAAADAITIRANVVIGAAGWSPKVQRDRAPALPQPLLPGDRALPTGVTYNRLNGDGRHERVRPFVAWLHVERKTVYLGHFASVEMAVAFRTWALVQHGKGQRFKLTRVEREQWERTVTVAAAAPQNPKPGDVWIKP